MATNRAVSGLATTNLVIGVIAILGGIAIALGAALGRLPRNLPQVVVTRLEDAAFFAFLLCGPLCLVAGIGLRKRRRWGQQMTLALGGLGGVLAIASGVLAGLGVLQTSSTDDFLMPVCFATYCVAVFVTLWDEKFVAETL
jgi:peptidoglycan/LPS O-acetylase OafA/YrhL